MRRRGTSFCLAIDLQAVRGERRHHVLVKRRHRPGPALEEGVMRELAVDGRRLNAEGGYYVIVEISPLRFPGKELSRL